MDEKELRGLLVQRLHLEQLLFKDSMLQKEKKNIFKASCEIEIYMTMYGISLEKADYLDMDTMRGLLYLRFGILGSICHKWMDRQESFYGSYDELSTFVYDELELIAEMGRTGCSGGEEDEDGTGYDQAA